MQGLRVTDVRFVVVVAALVVAGVLVVVVTGNVRDSRPGALTATDVERAVGGRVEFSQDELAPLAEIGVTPCADRRSVGSTTPVTARGDVTAARALRFEGSNGVAVRESLLAYGSVGAAQAATARTLPVVATCRQQSTLTELVDVSVTPVGGVAPTRGWAVAITSRTSAGDLVAYAAAVRAGQRVAFVTVESVDAPVDAPAFEAMVQAAGARLRGEAPVPTG